MAGDTYRSVRLERTSLGRYRAENPRGGSIPLGEGDDADFTPVELLLAAIAGCTAVDVDHITAKRAEPDTFAVAASGDKIRDESGNRMTNLAVTFHVTFPDGDSGDAARAVLPRAVAQSHDRLCTVSRTVESGASVDTRIEAPETRGGG
ncbi:MAG: OsmC family peroxiredoxin [Micromonosporaceae bacterium]|nr:OsmC family peroxiredoxin [Micromonosporaceae bacterium]